MPKSDTFICIGAVAGAFGVRGEVRIKSFAATPEDIFDYSPLVDENGETVLTIASWRPVKDGFAAYVEEVADREGAQALKSTRLHVQRSRLPETGDNEYYHADLVGMAVVDLEGRPLGEVRAVQNYGAADLLEIWRTPGMASSWHLPFTRDAAPHVDLAKRQIIADPPEGAELGPMEEK